MEAWHQLLRVLGHFVITSRPCRPVLFPGRRPTGLNHDPPRGQPSLLRPRSALFCRYGNISPFPIDFALPLRLRGRLTLPGLSLDRNPWASGEWVFHPLYRYSRQHSHFQALHHSSRGSFNALGTLPYHSYESTASVACLSPVIFTAQTISTSELLRFL